MRHHHRHSGVPGDANLRKNGNFSQKSDILALRLGVSSAMSKYFHPLSVWRRVITHVFNDPEDGNIHFLKHANPLAHDSQRSFLRRGDDDPAVERYRLAKG